MKHLRTTLPFPVMLMWLMTLMACQQPSAGLSREEKENTVVFGMPSSAFEEEYYAASDLSLAGFPDSALKIYQGLLEKEPDSMHRHIYLNIGSVYIQKEDYTAAVDMYEKALAYDTTDAQANYALGGGYYRMRDYQQAIWYNTIAARVDPYLPDCHMILAGSYEQLMNPGLAIFHARRFIELAPDSQHRGAMEELIARNQNIAR